MFIFRVISLVLIAAALMLLGADALTTLDAQAVEPGSFRTLTQALNLVSAGLADSLVTWSDNSLGFASSAVGPIMGAPAWIPIGVLGLILAFLFRIRD